MGCTERVPNGIEGGVESKVCTTPYIIIFAFCKLFLGVGLRW